MHRAHRPTSRLRLVSMRPPLSEKYQSLSFVDNGLHGLAANRRVVVDRQGTHLGPQQAVAGESQLLALRASDLLEASRELRRPINRAKGLRRCVLRDAAPDDNADGKCDRNQYVGDDTDDFHG
jgi:hypothetical protein